MATVTVVTAQRTLEIEATSIVDGEINANGHLILTRHDGTPLDMGAVSGMQMNPGDGYSKVDAFAYVGPTDPGPVAEGSVWYDTNEPAGPYASTTQKGLVELATNAETQAGVDNTRAVTPASLASVPGSKTIYLGSNINTESAGPTAYPTGLSLMNLTTGSNWSVANGFGTVLTSQPFNDRTVQLLFGAAGGSSTPRTWFRQWHTSTGGGGWTRWSSYNTTVTVDPATITQTTALASYPTGWSRAYFTTTNATGWDFSGSAGELLTYVDGTDFAKQTWTKHAKGTEVAEMWIRTANQANSWAPWRKFITDPGPWTSWTPSWVSSSGNNLPSYGNAVVDCRSVKIGRTVECRFEIQFGTTTTYGATGAADNWEFSLPYPVARVGDQLGFVQLQQGNSKSCMGAARATSSNRIRITVCSAFVDGTAPTNTGDIDQATPAPWSSGNAIRGSFTYEAAS